MEQIPCWPVLGNICVILVVRGFRGVVVRGLTAGRELLTEVTDHWGQTALWETCCWRSGSEQLVSTKRTAVHEKQLNRVSQTLCGTKQSMVDQSMCCLPCRWHWWNPWTCTEPAAARELRTQLSPEEMNPDPRGSSNMQGLLTCKKTLSVLDLFLSFCHTPRTITEQTMTDVKKKSP